VAKFVRTKALLYLPVASVREAFIAEYHLRRVGRALTYKHTITHIHVHTYTHLLTGLTAHSMAFHGYHLYDMCLTSPLNSPDTAASATAATRSGRN
jgi:hypothetical protein